MEENILKIKLDATDLPDGENSWKTMSYAEKQQEIVSFVVSKKGAPPQSHMVSIREISFCVPATVTLDCLKSLSQEIRRLFTIDCFQIYIDREKKIVHMLFDWYDRENQRCVFLYEAKQCRLAATIIKYLDLPINLKDIEGKYLRHILSTEYERDPEIFDKLLSLVKHQSNNSRSYKLLLTSLSYLKLHILQKTK